MVFVLYMVICGMDYTISKYAFPVRRKLPNNKEVCLFFSGRTGKNIYVSPSAFLHVMKGEYDLLDDKVRTSLIDQKIIVSKKEDEFSEVNEENRLLLKREPNDRLYISIQPTASCQLA